MWMCMRVEVGMGNGDGANGIVPWLVELEGRLNKGFFLLFCLEAPVSSIYLAFIDCQECKVTLCVSAKSQSLFPMIG